MVWGPRGVASPVGVGHEGDAKIIKGKGVAALPVFCEGCDAGQELGSSLVHLAISIQLQVRRTRWGDRGANLRGVQGVAEISRAAEPEVVPRGEPNSPIES